MHHDSRLETWYKQRVAGRKDDNVGPKRKGLNQTHNPSFSPRPPRCLHLVVSTSNVPLPMSFTQLKAAAKTVNHDANLSTQSRHNPHAPGIKKWFVIRRLSLAGVRQLTRFLIHLRHCSLWVWMNTWYEAEGRERYAKQDDAETSTTLAVVDLECAKSVTQSGETFSHAQS